MPKKPATKKQLAEMGPLARTIAEIERGPRCPNCGRSTRRGDHDCRKAL
jgi:hypothetical protein